MPLLSTKQVIIRIALIIATVEFIVMMTLGFAPLLIDTYTEAILDGVLLTIISSPLIYLWVIRPFVRARDEALAQISNLAFTDPLTQLANRRHLVHHLQGLIASCVRHKMYGALLAIDLDGFKQINDLHGHDAGDAVLIEIAQRFRSAIRIEDMAGRMGGDEFLIMIDHLSTDEVAARKQALHISEKLISLANIAFDYDGKCLRIGASVGIFLLGNETLDVDDAINKADAAMYRAKKAGKGLAVFFE
jgi:diguanylate cyclase (GGDEF)-like protein